jgi:hypothetical protein
MSNNLELLFFHLSRQHTGVVLKKAIWWNASHNCHGITPAINRKIPIVT